MAKRKKYNKQKSGSKSKYTELEKFAYNMGKVQKGLSSDTRVKDSYEAGKGSSKQGKKPLC